VPTSASGGLDTKTNAPLPPGPLQGVAGKPTASRSLNERPENGQQIQEFATLIPPTSTLSGSGASRLDAISVDEDKYDGAHDTRRHRGDHYDFGVPTGFGEREIEGLLPGMSSFWDSLQAPMPVPSSYNLGLAKPDGSSVSGAETPLTSAKALTNSSIFMSSPSSTMVASASSALGSPLKAHFAAQAFDSGPISLEAWRPQYTNMLPQTLQSMSDSSPPTTYAHLESPSVVLSSPPTCKIARSRYSPQEYSDTMSGLGYPSPEIDVSGEALVQPPSSTAIFHEQVVSGQLRQHQHDERGRCISYDHRPEDPMSLLDIEMPMSMSDADVAGISRDDFMEDFAGLTPKGNGTGEEVGLEEIGVEFLKRCVSARLFVFYNIHFYNCLLFIIQTSFSMITLYCHSVIILLVFLESI
jgi:hypothetical protein